MMMQKELWIDNLAQALDITYDVSMSIWNQFVGYCYRLLSQNKVIELSPFFVLYQQKRNEYLAHLQDGKYYLIPPQIIVVASNEPRQSYNNQMIAVYDVQKLSSMFEIDEEKIKQWCDNVKRLINDAWQQRKMVFLPELICITFDSNIDDKAIISISDECIAFLNKPFDMFAVQEINTPDNFADLSIREIGDIEDCSVQKVFYLSIEPEETKDDTSLQITTQEKNDILSAIVDDPSTQVVSSVSIEAKTNERPKFNKLNNYWKRSMFVVFILLVVVVFSRWFWYWITKEGHKYSGVLPKSEISSKNRIGSNTKMVPQKNNLYVLAKPTKHRSDSLLKTLKSIDENKKSLPVQHKVSTYTVPLNADTTEVVEISYGDRLAKYALKKYGNRVFWVYIYEENRAIIDNPNYIPIGTKIVLPSAKKYNIDAVDTNSVKKALVLEKVIQNQFK